MLDERSVRLLDRQDEAVRFDAAQELLQRLAVVDAVGHDRVLDDLDAEFLEVVIEVLGCRP